MEPKRRPERKRLVDWMGSSKRDLKALPWDAKQCLTYGIRLAELGKRHPEAKKLVGLDVEEVVCDSNTDTFRAVYTLSLDDWVYVLHCFQKKAKRGLKTPQADIELIKRRLKDAQALHKKEGRDRPRAE